MPEYLAPGVYTEEIDIGSKPIEGVSTSTAGFVGETERGPVAVRLITSYTQYENVYGGYAWKSGTTPSTSFLPYALSGFFANGGKRCFIGRVVGAEARSASLNVTAADGALVVTALGAGEWGNRIGVSVGSASNAREDTKKKLFKLRVFYWTELPAGAIVDPLERANFKEPNRRDPQAQEIFDNLSTDPASADYFVRRINNSSHLIAVKGGDPVVKGTDDTPAKPAAKAKVTDETTTDDPDARKGGDKITALRDGADGKAVAIDDFKGKPGEDVPTGLAGLAEIDDISIVCVPNENELGLTDAVVTHCELLKDRIAVLQSKDDGDISTLYPAATSKYAATYYPSLKINDPATNLPKLIPPGGHVAGIYARSDAERGVHKAPANEAVRGIVDLKFNVTKGEQEILNPRGVNCIRAFTGRGILVWGARTTTDDPLWKYVNVRRLFIFLEKSIERSTQWVVFEPNTERLWARLRQTVNDFLTQVWKDGALMGLTPDQAFFVKCDRTTMTDNDIENGRLVVMVGVAPARPAEFVIFRLAQWRAGSALTE